MLSKSVETLTAISFFFMPLSMLFIYRFHAPFSAHALLFGVLFVSLILLTLFCGRMPRLNISIALFLVSITIIAPVSIFSTNIELILTGYIRLFTMMIPYFVLLLALPIAPEAPVVAARWFSFGSVASAIYALQLFFAGEIFYAGRLTFAAEHNPTTFGSNLATSLLLMGWLYGQKRISGLVLSASVPILVVSLVLSQSRNAMIALIIALGLTACLKSYRSIRLWNGRIKILRNFIPFFLRLLAVTLILVGIIVAVFSSFEIDERFYSRILATIELSSATDATAGRDTIWGSYLALDVPFFGFGLDSTSTLLQQVEIEQLPHNAFILSYIHGGIIFFFLYIGFVLTFLFELSEKSTERFSFLLATGLFAAFLGLGTDAYIYAIFWAPLSISLILHRYQTVAPLKGSLPAGSMLGSNQTCV
ncbi:O-antigen ligase family protein [Roseovarius sp. CH_XMU1461]|uniref:O-antigen ligase family protein n=1 Tax=Roseovarius sp. CH_XMU1461 TaxID=3107777 RepID=UPI00300B6066